MIKLNKEFNLVNDLGCLIKFFKPYREEAAKKETAYQDKIREAEISVMKDGGLNQKQLGRLKGSKRRKTMAKLRQVSITNRFLKVSDRESNLHKGYAYMFCDTKTFGIVNLTITLFFF